MAIVIVGYDGGGGVCLWCGMLDVFWWYLLVPMCTAAVFVF
jgi:hypothetical protein